MNPSCKLPCYMNSSSTKLLQIPSTMRGSYSKMLQILLKWTPPKKNKTEKKKPNNSARPRNGKKYATKLMGQTIIFMGTWRM